MCCPAFCFARLQKTTCARELYSIADTDAGKRGVSQLNIADHDTADLPQHKRTSMMMHYPQLTVGMEASRLCIRHASLL
jgi:hypothetical protein